MMTFQEQKDFLKAGNYFFIPNDIFSYELTPKAYSKDEVNLFCVKVLNTA